MPPGAGEKRRQDLTNLALGCDLLAIADLIAV
jgi:hypothetical protein